MAIDTHAGDRTPLRQAERGVLKVLHTVVAGPRTQAEAARLLRLSVRQVRRRRRRVEADGDQAVVHGPRGRPSNHRLDPRLRQRAVPAYRRHYPDFGPPLASERRAAQGPVVAAEALRRRLWAEGLWRLRRQRDAHRRRRPRRSCFGELPQMDTSLLDWGAGRGQPMALVALIDDATSWVEAGF